MIGSGISRMRDGMSAAGYPEPVFEPGKIWFSVMFRKKADEIYPGPSGDQVGTKWGPSGDQVEILRPVSSWAKSQFPSV